MIRPCAIILLYLVAGGVSAAANTFEPVTPVEPAAHLDDAKVRLGRKLFLDPRLSRDNQRACATCHNLQGGGDDGRARSRGVDGEPLEFNTPTIFNVAGNFRLNWRGNFRSLEDQNESVLLNTRIMDTTWPELEAKLREDPAYQREFSAVYRGGPTRSAVLDALATFERSLVTPNSRFDRRLRGEQGAMSPEEERGYQLFKSYGCVACHQGANFGGNLFQPFGIFDDPFAPRGEGVAHGAPATIPGEGARRLFRVPSLRNVAVTPPYFHNGRTASLVEAVEIMARSQLGRTLPEDDVRLIVQFLGTLTGEFEGRPLSDPGRRPE
jgi:cytochrome c peroxidase